MEKWFKMLDELTSHRNPTSLDRRIHEEILVKGEQFTQKKAKQFAPGLELLSKLIVAQNDYESKNGGFGDMFGEYLLRTENTWKRGGQFLTPMNIAKFMVKLSLSDDKKQLLGKPQITLDPAAGTGRFMLMTAKHYAETVGQLNFMFVNIDIDHIVYVYCAMNAILHGIPALTVWGDSLLYEFREGIVTLPLGKVAMWKVLKKDKITAIMKRMAPANTKSMAPTTFSHGTKRKRKRQPTPKVTLLDFIK